MHGALDPLVISFQSLTSCAVISEEVMLNHFLPGLRCLRTDMEQLSPEHEVRRPSHRGGVDTHSQCTHVFSVLSASSHTDRPDCLLLHFFLTHSYTHLCHFLFVSRNLMRSISCEHFPEVTNDQLIVFHWTRPLCPRSLHTRFWDRNYFSNRNFHACTNR